MNLDCQPHDHKHSIFISFLNDDHFLLSVSEMRVILVAFLSLAFAYAPNLSLLKELFRSLPSSGNISSNSIQYVPYYKFRTIQSSIKSGTEILEKWSRCNRSFLEWALWDFERWCYHAFHCSNIFQKRRYEPSGGVPSSWAQLTSPRFDRMASRLFNFDVPMNL